MCDIEYQKHFSTDMSIKITTAIKRMRCWTPVDLTVNGLLLAADDDEMSGFALTFNQKSCDLSPL